MTSSSPQPGRFGAYGGSFVPETLVPSVRALEAAYGEAQADPAFWEELDALHRSFTGRPTPLYEATRLSAQCGGARIFFKREDLAHTGAHKINNALGQGLLAKRMGKTRIIAETGAGQHGSPAPPSARCSASSAWSTWAPRIWSARSPTSSVCG
jgi:tryptophan synthase beta chain